MLSVRGRKPVATIVDPIAKTLLKLGLTPNQITVFSAVLTITASVLLIPSNHLVAAAFFTGTFACFDLIDGTMARLRGGGTKFGATLDASCDRITDGVLFASIVWWLVYVRDASHAVVVAALVVLVASQVISYVKARGEASGFTMVGGLVERPERLIVSVFGLGFTGLGLTYAIDVAIWILAAGSIFTIYQRLKMAAASPGAGDPIPPPPGARRYPPK